LFDRDLQSKRGFFPLHLGGAGETLSEGRRGPPHRLERDVTAAMRSLADRLGEVEGDSLERRYRERAADLFQQILARIRVLDHQELGLLLDEAVDAGALTPEEKAEILRADAFLRGCRDQRETYALAEVSAVIDAEDVRRAAARARLLQRAVGAPVLPVVAGRRMSDDAAQAASTLGVWRLLDGRAEAPAEDGGRDAGA